MRADSGVARRFLLIGSTALPLGVALAAVGARATGSIVTLIAAAALIAGLHTFGRAGPDLGEPGATNPAKGESRNDEHV
jgi:hypothetical protein